MKKQYNSIRQIYNEMENNKYAFLQSGYAYEFTIIDKKTGENYHSGIGTGEDMTMLNLITLFDLWRTAASCSIEEFAESVKDTLIRYAEDREDGDDADDADE